MGKRRYLALTISVAILFGVCAVSASAKDFPCSSLRKAEAALLIYNFGAPLPNEMDFSHGLGCYSEGESPCDWKVTVTQDRYISDDRRLILVNTEHVTGQGERSDVIVLGCLAGKVTTVFESARDEGVDVEDATADKLVLKSAKRGPRDPMAGASMEVRQVYVWSKDTQQYLPDREYIFDSATGKLLRSQEIH
jgi:hypothetical protein